MKALLSIFSFIILSYNVACQNANNIRYTLTHNQGDDKINIKVEFDSISSKNVQFVIPRSGPGTYDLTDYILYCENVFALTSDGNRVNSKRGIGSFYIFPDTESALISISYEVDIKRMETELVSASSSSKVRTNYLGILGYSVFGFVEGLENDSLDLIIKTDTNTPIFSTLFPKKERKKGLAEYSVKDFADLADGQYFLGNGFDVIEVVEAPIPLFVVVYSETNYNIEEIGRRILIAISGLKDYFGYIPMPHYTACFEYLKPISEKHDYGFSMEHLNSMTASFDTSRAIVRYEVNAGIGSIIHHIGHSWIPLRSYGKGYRPFQWQTAPLIETIWLNEGFIWYIAYFYILDNKPILDVFKENLHSAPEYIKQKSLRELSLLGSTQYAKDFRIGRNLFSRGALFAYDLDNYIKDKTSNQKSFKDVILGLLAWTEKNNRAFDYEEIESIMSSSVGVDLLPVWDSWQGAKMK